MPSLNDAALQLIWREKDAVKNSISMLAQSLFSHKQLQNLNSNQMQDKMFIEKGVNWNNLETCKKRGTYIKRFKVSLPFTVDELSSLPKNHKARINPNLVFERNLIKEIELPLTNKLDIIKEILIN